MKFVEFDELDLNRLQLFRESRYRVTVLHTSTLPSGDTLALIADKQQNSRIRILWVPMAAVDAKPQHLLMP